MSTSETTNSPLNITGSNVSGRCDLKCAYNFNYTTTSLVATNYGIQISLQVDEQNVAPVTYNTEQYKVTGIVIRSSSMLLYNGTQAAGEIEITHEPVNGGSQLIVFIPLYESTNSTAATNLITEIITDVASSAPSSGEQTTINLNNFTLQSIVPKRPFYTFSLLNSTVNCIAYGIKTGIPINQTTLSSLSTIITPTSVSDIPQTELFVNDTGPNMSGSNIGEGIYISCNPTGSSESTTSVEVTNTTTNDLANLINNPVVIQVFVGCLLFIVVFFIISMIFNFIAGKPMQLPSYLTPKKTSTTSTSAHN